MIRYLGKMLHTNLNVSNIKCRVFLGTEGELQLRSFRTAGQRKGRKVSGRGASPHRLPVQRSRGLSRGKSKALKFQNAR